MIALSVATCPCIAASRFAETVQFRRFRWSRGSPAYYHSRPTVGG